MKKHIQILGVLVFLLVGTQLIAQEGYNPQFNNDSKGIVYNKEFTVDFRAHTNGFMALALNFGTIKTYYKTRYYHFEIGEIKHNKEYRSRDLASTNVNRPSSSFIYGKQNSLYALRAGIGTKHYLTEKAVQKGLAIGINYEYGASLGLLKPYYIEIESSDSNPNRSLRYSEEEAANFLDFDNIVGHSNFSKGLNEISVVPGINGKFGLIFDWGAFDEYAKSVEVGIMADIYFRTIPLMVDNVTLPSVASPPAPPSDLEITPAAVRNRPFFVNLYISLQLGKRR